jgi:hypothetical protein
VTPSFKTDILPIFDAKCALCHKQDTGWNATSYEKATTSGDSKTIIIPKDSVNSILAKKIHGLGEGLLMPPGGKLSDEEILLILNWINAGAPNN